MKHKNRYTFQKDKRNAFLSRQKTSRADQRSKHRILSLAEETAPIEEVEIAQDIAECCNIVDKSLYSSDRWGVVVSLPEYMTSVPDFSCHEEKWAVTLRPRGVRCLVVSSRGRTVSRTETGAVLQEFTSFLPRGGRTKHDITSSCILDCVLVNDTYYILDMLSWGSMEFFDCDAEMRHFFLQSKLQEHPAILSLTSPPFFQPLPYVECTAQAIHDAYHAPMPFPKDCLLFFHQQGHYSIGISPLFLTWRDNVESDEIYTHLCSLQTSSGWVLVTYEGYMVHWLQQEVVDIPLHHGGIAYGMCSNAFIDVSGAAVIDAFQILGFSTRCYPDFWSKIVFSQQTKTSPISLADLCSR